ncbi:Glycosyl transferase-like protein [Rhodospirillaceae bacterium LM-1]|nr:Glycosyl transferase-like protein [Rhodospirillaceae bacterium LM-1]
MSWTRLSRFGLALYFTEGTSLADWQNCGILSREVALYNRLADHFKMVRFITYGKGADTCIASGLPNIRVHCNTWRMPQRLRYPYLRYAAPIFWRHPTIVKSNQIRGAQLALGMARRFGFPFVARCGYLLSEELANERGVDSPQYSRALELERQVFSGADRVIVTTERMRAVIAEQYRVSHANIAVIPNFVDTGAFFPQERPPHKRIRIGFVGRLERQKNLSALIDATAGLDVELVFVGSGSLRDALASRAARLDVSLALPGNLPNYRLVETLLDCDIFVLPSHYEGHPKALMEAMALGIPCIGTNVTGIREVLTHGETGLLCEPTPAALRQSVGDMISSSELRRRLGEQAAKFVHISFSLDRCVELELGLHEELATLFGATTNSS